MNSINNFNRPQKRSGGGCIKFIVFFIVLTVIAIGGVYMWYNNAISAPLSNSDDLVAVNVEQGETRDSIAKKLVEIGVLEDTKVFVWYTKISGEGSEIKAGSHEFPKSVNIKQLVKALEEAPNESTVWVTIPEGLRYDEIAEIISKGFEGKENAVFSKEKFLEIAKNPRTANLSASTKQFLVKYIPEGKSIEGFLYPDTYNFFVYSTTEEVVNTLVGTLISKVDTGELSKTKYSFYEIITIASMLEREAYTEQEAKMIADVIYKRLDQGYFLGIDATTLYEKKDWKYVLDDGDFMNPTPYNTRKVMGLPPTPISNPSITTIEAALNPTPNDYLYYLHDSSNQIYYAKDNAGHEANKRKYL